MKNQRLPKTHLLKALLFTLALFFTLSFPIGAQARTYKNLRALYPMVNAKVIKQVKRHHCKLVTTDNLPYYLGGLTKGRFWFTGRKKHVKFTMYVRPQYLGTTVAYHELGHCIDFLCSKMYIRYNTGYVRLRSSYPDFKRIYEIEKNNYHSLDRITSRVYTVSTSMEYFAQCFADYTLHPRELYNMCPNTFHYIRKCVKLVKKGKVIPR